MNKDQKNAKEPEYRYLKPASAQDCTGLIPAGPVQEQDWDDYEDLYPFLPKVPEGAKETIR